ncbi:MAG: VCBS repeat-containing protein [Polyangiaceae bacterium]|nr:VCBS repeat-containing protein [Polyangiaceae bacterium]
MRTLYRSVLVLSILPLASALSGACSGDTDASGTGQTTNSAGSGGAGGKGGAGGEDLTTVGPGPGSGGGMGGMGGLGGAGGVEEDCLFVPPPGDFAPELDCAWNAPAAGSPYQAYDDVVSTPVVVNLTDDTGDGVVDIDDIPDIAFVTYRLQEDGCCNTPGVLRIVSGACNADGTMTEHLSIGANEIEADTGMAGVWLDNSGGIAAGDIDADGSVDIVGTIRNGGTIAFERTGKVKWVQANHPSAASKDHLAGTTPSIADLDADGKPEIIQGRVVLNGADGSLKWAGANGTGVNAFMGPVSAVGDVDLNGTLNVLAGNTLYEADGTPLWTYAFPVPSDANNCAAPAGYTCDGYTATGNFDADNQGEIVIVRAGAVYILNHDGTLLDVGGVPANIAIPKAACAKNEGGPPTVADFDGDGQAEIGVAAANYYIVADLECLATPLPAQCSDPGIRWKVANQDCSSRVTGSSVFDFDGDGKAEVVYNDEQFFRVFSGTDGAVLIQVANRSHTRLEMPIIADVDNDGNAEILFVENKHSGGPSQGIRVYGDAKDSWVPTRRIWNQHSYHVTNVTELGGIPQKEPVSWLEPTDSTPSGKMNIFRQNLPDYDVFAAPDLTVDLSFSKADCPASLGLVASVCNKGAVVVGAGATVTFYDNATQAEIACTNAPVATTLPIPPGKCQAVTCKWAGAPMSPLMVDVRACVDNGSYACDTSIEGGNNECKEDNNAGNSGDTGCTGDPQ